jgi:hypothetical protein
MVDLVDEVGQLSLAQDTVRAALTAQAADIAAGAVTGFDGWYDMDAITSWAARLVRALEAIHRNLARSTDAYLARVSSRTVGALVRPVGAVDVTTLRAGGVTHAGAYARAADVYRFQQSLWDRVATRLDKPPTLVSPLDAAVGRVRAVADLDAQLVVRDQSRQFMTSQPAVVGWRRVFYPELSSGGSCGLCITAATEVTPRARARAVSRGGVPAWGTGAGAAPRRPPVATPSPRSHEANAHTRGETPAPQGRVRRPGRGVAEGASTGQAGPRMGGLRNHLDGAGHRPRTASPAVTTEPTRSHRGHRTTTVPYRGG